MSQDEFPYVAQCSFCENGLLRFMRCLDCEAIVAICDECELIWKNVAEVSQDPNITSSAAFPNCPACGMEEAEWAKLDESAVMNAKLEQYVGGKSV